MPIGSRDKLSPDRAPRGYVKVWVVNGEVDPTCML